MIPPKALFQWSQRLPFQHYSGQAIASVFGLAFPGPSRAPPCPTPHPALHDPGPGSSQRCPRRRQKSQTSDCLGCFRRVREVPRELPPGSMLGGGGTARPPTAPAAASGRGGGAGGLGPAPLTARDCSAEECGREEGTGTINKWNCRVTATFYL